MSRLVKFSGPPSDPGSWRPEIDPKHSGHLFIAPNAYRALIEVGGFPDKLDELLPALRTMTPAARREMQRVLHWAPEAVDSAIEDLASFAAKEC